jgi:peptidoglycan/LPS O-acetylase OafA/YrhL
MNFRQDIQGLRALAVIAVILFHIDKNILPGGFIGVDIFFVISGFLISKSIIEGKDKGQFNFFRFFIGRFKRIVPAYYFMMVACILIAAFYFPGSYFKDFFYPARHALLFISNRIFELSTNYFGGQNHENLILHTWSLSIEMQFYFFLPLLIYITPKKWRAISFVALLIILLGYTEYNLRILEQQSPMYFSLPARSLEFIVGILINFLPINSKMTRIYKNIISLFALLIVILSLILIDEHTVFPGLTALPACLGIAAIIWVQASKVNSFFSNQFLVYIGKLSYSLYLWHWPVLAFYRYKTMGYNISITWGVILTIIFVLLSLISFYLVEVPFREMKSKKMYFSLSFITMAVFSLWYYSDLINKNFIAIPLEYITQGEKINHHKYDGYVLNGDESLPDSKILIIGDSHARSMHPFFDKIGKNYKFNFVSFSNDEIPPIKGLSESRFRTNEEFHVYQNLSKQADSLISKAEIIILIRHWHSYYDFKGPIAYLEKKIRPNQSLVILTDYPALHQDPVRKYMSLVKPIDIKNEELLMPSIDIVTMRAIAKNKNFYLLDITDEKFFRSAPYFNDTLMYIDASHINIYGSKKLANFQGKKVADFLMRLKNN